jgi:hypothetical protein
MKRAILAIFGAAFLLAHAPAARADGAFDRDMASRYLRAAQSGEDEAQFYLGALYSAGIGVPRSDEEAFRWFSRAADQGHSHAMLILSGLYAIGRGVQKDNVRAYEWAYLVGSASKVEEFRNGSRQLISVLESRMSSEEISRARADAMRWRPATAARPTPTVAPPVRPAPLPIATSAPAPVPAPVPAPAIANPQPPVKSTSNEPSPDIAKGIKKGDVASFLDQVPSGLRKRFGF